MRRADGARHPAADSQMITPCPSTTCWPRHQLCLATLDMAPWSRWITPVVPSMTNMANSRFDTRFFVAVLPAGQTALHDGHENTESVWLAPREALQRYWDGTITLAPPQIMSLAHLSRHADTASVLHAARGKHAHR
jgi:hypothetical protein